MPLTLEQQVDTLCEVMRKVSSSAWRSETELRKAIPCSLAELNAATAETPSAERLARIEEALRQVSLVEHLRHVDLDQLAGLAEVAPDDPRVPGFLAQLEATWPAPEEVRNLLALQACFYKVADEAAKARPQMDPEIALAKGLVVRSRDVV